MASRVGMRDVAASLLKWDEPDGEAPNWRVWRELSVRKYAEEYDCLNIHFDEYTGESQVTQEDMRKAIDQHDVAGLVEESQGARIIDLEKYKLGKAIVRKKGASHRYPHMLAVSDHT